MAANNADVSKKLDSIIEKIGKMETDVAVIKNDVGNMKPLHEEVTRLRVKMGATETRMYGLTAIISTIITAVITFLVKKFS